MWGALSNKRTGLTFTIAAGPRRRSHSRVQVPWDSWPYFTDSDSRLPFSSPSTTRRATVEVFYHSSTRDTFWLTILKLKVTLWLTLSQSVSLGVEPHPRLMTRYLLLFDSYDLVFVDSLSDERLGLSFYILLALASAAFLGSESLGTHDNILLSQIWDFPFRRLLRLAGSRWRYSTPPPHGS
jgi:hypothetical protein